MKPAILFLCHRIPYPPNKGDKIRSYHLLRHLSEKYRVFLGTFIDDTTDWQYVPLVEALCEQSLFVKLDPFRAKLKSLSGLLEGKPLTLPYYSSDGLSAWVREVVQKHKISRLMVYSSAMAQFANGKDLGFQIRVIDFVDIDSDKWRQYAKKKAWPMSWVYRRESDYLLKFEQQITAEYDASLFVSSTEAAHFKQLTPRLASKIGFYNNGVDTDYFSTDAGLTNPYPEKTNIWVFTGAMDYWANCDAVSWFAESVWPRLKELGEQSLFYIVGSNPTEQVKALEKKSGVVVTGRVEDIRPYLQYATAVVVPMGIARGIQNKVLEGMAMCKPVMVSRLGLEGINAIDQSEVLLADHPDEYLSHAERLLRGEYPNIGIAARSRVEKDFNWAESLPRVSDLLEAEAVHGEREIADGSA